MRASLYRVPQGVMTNVNPNFFLYDNNNECTRLDIIFFPNSTLVRALLHLGIKAIIYSSMFSGVTLHDKQIKGNGQRKRNRIRLEVCSYGN